jgi:hypothetical protein
MIPFARRIVEELVNELLRGGDFPDAEGRLPHALQRQ